MSISEIVLEYFLYFIFSFCIWLIVIPLTNYIVSKLRNVFKKDKGENRKMKCKLVGIRGPFEYTSKKTGETYNALNLAFVYPRRGWQGGDAMSIFLRCEKVDGLLRDLVVGADIEISYNMFGNVESVKIV